MQRLASLLAFIARNARRFLLIASIERSGMEWKKERNGMKWNGMEKIIRKTCRRILDPKGFFVVGFTFSRGEGGGAGGGGR